MKIFARLTQLGICRHRTIMRESYAKRMENVRNAGSIFARRPRGRSSPGRWFVRLPRHRRRDRAPCPGGGFDHRKGWAPGLGVVGPSCDARSIHGVPVNGHGWFKADRRRCLRRRRHRRERVERLLGASTGSLPPPPPRSSSSLHLMAAIRADSLRGTPGRERRWTLRPLLLRLTRAASARGSDAFARRVPLGRRAESWTRSKFNSAITPETSGIVVNYQGIWGF